VTGIGLKQHFYIQCFKNHSNIVVTTYNFQIIINSLESQYNKIESFRIPN
jgi:hypothetical protein